MATFNSFKTPKTLTRTESTSSLISTMEEEEVIKPTYTVANVIKQTKTLILKITIDSETNLSEETNTFLKRIKSNLNYIEEEYKQRTKEILILETTQDNMKEENNTLKGIIHNMTDKISSPKEITKLVLHSISEHITGNTKQTDDMDSLKESLLLQNKSPQDTEEHHSTKKTPPPPHGYSSRVQDTDEDTTTHRRTLIVRQTSGNNPKLTGAEIMKNISKVNITCPTAAIDKIYTRKYHIEIICNTESNKTYIQRELQKHQALNRYLTITTKQPSKQKMTLTDVPNNITTDEIADTITTLYKVHREDIVFIRTQDGRFENTLNHIIALPVTLCKNIINEEGLQMNLTKCRLRPYTQITR